MVAEAGTGRQNHRWPNPFLVAGKEFADRPSVATSFGVRTLLRGFSTYDSCRRAKHVLSCRKGRPRAVEEAWGS